MKKNYFLLTLLGLMSQSIFAQTPVQVVDDFLNQAKRKGSVDSKLDYRVINENIIGDNKGDYIKIQQTINGIPVYGSSGAFHIQQGEVINHNQSFVYSNVDKSLSVTPKLNVDQAIESMATKLGKDLIAFSEDNLLTQAKNAKNELPVDLVSYLKDSPSYLYYYDDKGELKLSWIVLTEIKDSKNPDTIENLFETIIDANTGELLHKQKVIHSCSFHPEGSKHNIYHNNPDDFLWISEVFYPKEVAIMDSPLNASYKVIPATQQSPLKSDFKLLSNTYDPIASKEGWHKLLPSAAEKNANLTKYHTVGNNMQVGYDKNGEFSDQVFGISTLLIGSSNLFIKNEAYGGESLIFDFPTPEKSTNYDPLDYTESATTQMFYSMNTIHDILYYHGFNPKAGSFQMNEGDKRRVFGFSTSGLGEVKQVKNNAIMAYNSLLVPNPTTMFFTFETLPEDAGVMEIKEGELKGVFQGAFANNEGYKYGSSPAVSSKVVLVNDNAGTDTNDGCETIVNGEQIKGKIALVNRGTCSFGDKVNQIKGFEPKGIIILNNQTTDISGSLDVSNLDLTIPIVAINKSIADKIKTELQNNNEIEATLPSSNFKIQKRDSDFDSQVLLHEYVHAVSNRLSAGMIGGEEGMGEGWSDYVALNLTQQAYHTAKDQINMGEYAFGGKGLRILPYTTDINANPHTYDYLKEIGAGENLQHPTGYLWALMLWEMHWKLIDKYGFNPDFKSNTGGNNMALDLVLEGLKIQKDNPGFVDGRDGILMADVILNKGENQCLIWEAFAKRGLGYTANQGESASRIDGKEAFDLPPSCEKLATTEIEENNLTIYPNPVKDLVYISSKDQVEKYEIIDVTGRILKSGEVTSKQNVSSISTDSLPTGLFILKLHTSKGIVTKKILKK